MDRETIINKAKGLPVRNSEPVREAEDHEIWEGEEGDARFMLTKEQLPVNGMGPVYSLSLSGEVNGVKSLVTDFLRAFGEPVIAEENGQILFCLWSAKPVDASMNQ